MFKIPRFSRTLAIGLVLFAAVCPAAFADMGSRGNPLNKLMRGAINTVTGWVEVPKRVHETWNESGAGSAWTWGLLRGFGYGFVRTAAGVYEVVTFPFPAPPDYEPVMQPEYVFDDSSSDQGL